jgi:hypothetical protein
LLYRLAKREGLAAWAQCIQQKLSHFPEKSEKSGVASQLNMLHPDEIDFIFPWAII